MPLSRTFGGKRRAAPIVWERLGNVPNYVEPFFGSGAVLLSRPHYKRGARLLETVNDADGMVANFWRALQHKPEEVAFHADNPVNENDLHARHAWLVARKDSLQARLEGEPDYYDTKVAGWWAWGMSCWIGSGFCSGNGPWHVADVDGAPQLVKAGDAGQGVNRKTPHLGNAGMGVNRQRPHMLDYLAQLAERLRYVRVCCGDWTRIMGDTPMDAGTNIVAVFLDPPYADTADRTSDLYRVDSESVAHAVREWAIAHGDDPRYRIALCGYEDEHLMPDSWEAIDGKAGRGNGYGGQSREGYANAGRERIWFSPHCLKPERQTVMPL